MDLIQLSCAGSHQQQLEQQLPRPSNSAAAAALATGAAAAPPHPQSQQQQQHQQLPFPRPLPIPSSPDWSITAENLIPLLDALATDFLAWKGSSWDSYSESLRGYFMEKNIDPKVKYATFYVPQRHTVAVSYSWRGTTLRKIADKANEPSNNCTPARVRGGWCEVLQAWQKTVPQRQA
jgi:hypothetical protein